MAHTEPVRVHIRCPAMVRAGDLIVVPPSRYGWWAGSWGGWPGVPGLRSSRGAAAQLRELRGRARAAPACWERAGEPQTA